MLIEGDVLHPYRCGRSLPCFFGVLDCHFVFFLLVEMLVVDVGMDCSEGTVFLAALALKKLFFLL